MKTWTIVLIVVVVAVLAAGAYAMAVSNTYFDAQAACMRASEGRPAGQALSHLREIARKRSAHVVQSGDWTTAVFRSVVGSGYACGIRVQNGRLTEFRVARASEAEAKKAEEKKVEPKK